MTKYDSFKFIGKPKSIRTEAASGGVKFIFHCDRINFVMGNLTGIFEDCDISHYTSKDVSITKLKESEKISLEGIISVRGQSKDRELIALTLKEE